MRPESTTTLAGADAERPPGPADRPAQRSRRSALFGVAALLVPFAPRLAVATSGPPAATPAANVGAVRLDSNENPYGPSPAARRAILASAVEATRYGDAAIRQLATAVADFQHVDRSQIVIGSRSAEPLSMAAVLAATGGPDGELLVADPTFEQLPKFAAKLGVEVIPIPFDAGHARRGRSFSRCIARGARARDLAAFFAHLAANDQRDRNGDHEYAPDRDQTHDADGIREQFMQQRVHGSLRPGANFQRCLIVRRGDKRVSTGIPPEGVGFAAGRVAAGVRDAANGERGGRHCAGQFA